MLGDACPRTIYPPSPKDSANRTNYSSQLTLTNTRQRDGESRMRITLIRRTHGAQVRQSNVATARNLTKLLLTLIADSPSVAGVHSIQRRSRQPSQRGASGRGFSRRTANPSLTQPPRSAPLSPKR